MSAYPYGPEESFPVTSKLRAWRAQGQTRPDRYWIQPLAPSLRR